MRVIWQKILIQYFFRKLVMMLQILSSAAVAIGALRVKQVVINLPRYAGRFAHFFPMKPNQVFFMRPILYLQLYKNCMTPK